MEGWRAVWDGREVGIVWVAWWWECGTVWPPCAGNVEPPLGLQNSCTPAACSWTPAGAGGAAVALGAATASGAVAASGTSAALGAAVASVAAAGFNCPWDCLAGTGAREEAGAVAAALLRPEGEGGRRAGDGVLRACLARSSRSRCSSISFSFLSFIAAVRAACCCRRICSSSSSCALRAMSAAWCCCCSCSTSDGVGFEGLPLKAELLRVTPPSAPSFDVRTPASPVDGLPGPLFLRVMSDSPPSFDERTPPAPPVPAAPGLRTLPPTACPSLLSLGARSKMLCAPLACAASDDADAAAPAVCGC